jgi:hypothetical protein
MLREYGGSLEAKATGPLPLRGLEDGILTATKKRRAETAAIRFATGYRIRRRGRAEGRMVKKAV